MIVLADKRDGLARKKPLEQTHGFGEAFDSAPAGVKADPHLVVLDLHEPRPQAELEATIGQEIDGGGLPCHQHRMPEIVVQDIGTNTQMGRGVGRTHQRRQGREKILQVIWHIQHGIAERFHFPRFVPPGSP